MKMIPLSDGSLGRQAMVLLGLWLVLGSGGSFAAEQSTVTEEERLFETRCGLCHPSQRIFLVELTPEQRRHVVLRMRERWEGGAAWLSDEEIDQILAYVEKRVASGAAPQPDSEKPAKELFRERCSGCHELDRVYAQIKQERDKAAAWLHVVTRMRAKAPDWISEADAQRIVDYLRERTTPQVTK
ncbi:MAG: cytochrome c [Gammaproteobacteria bacterium]|nr:cytochrome c [Gammaproteobacteria bacterium]